MDIIQAARSSCLDFVTFEVKMRNHYYIIVFYANGSTNITDGSVFYRKEYYTYSAVEVKTTREEVINTTVSNSSSTKHHG